MMPRDANKDATLPSQDFGDREEEQNVLVVEM